MYLQPYNSANNTSTIHTTDSDPNAKKPNNNPIQENPDGKQAFQAAQLAAEKNQHISPPEIFKNWLQDHGLNTERIQFIQGPSKTFIITWPDHRPLDNEPKSVFRLSNEVPHKLVDLLHELNQAGVSVAPAKMFLGQLSHRTPEGFIVQYAFAPGKPRANDLNAQEAKQFGIEVAKLHQKTASWASSPLEEKPLHIEAFKNRFNDIKSWSHLFPSELLKQAETVFNALCKKLETLNPHYGYCHGDCHPSNAHFNTTNQGVQVTLLDWDTFAQGFPLYDVGTALSNMTDKPENQQAFLDGYTTSKGKPFTPQENECIDIFKAMRMLILTWMLIDLNADWLSETTGPNKTREPSKPEEPEGPSEEGFIQGLPKNLEAFVARGEGLV